MKKYSLALISPGREGSVVSGRWKGLVNFYRLTLPLLAGMTPQDKFNIDVYDECVDTIPLIKKYDLVALSAMTAYAPRAYELAKHYRNQGAKVIMGGQHATLLPNEVIQHVDAVAIGDAEPIWGRILTDYENDELKTVYRSDEVGIQLINRKIPDRSVIKSKSLLVFNTVETSRGCPYVCEYCTIASFYNTSYKKYPIESAIEEIASIKGKYIFFVDDNLIGGSVLDKNRTKELLKALIPLKKKWFCQATIKFADDVELLNLATLAGCVGVYLGLESISNESLKEVKKSWNRPESYVERIKIIRDHGIAIEAGLIFGFDHDDKNVFYRTAEFIEKTGIESPNAHLLTPYPGTPLFQRMKAEERILTYNWALYNTGNVVFQPLKMTPDELHDGYINWYQHMFSPTTILKRLRNSNFPYYTAMIALAKGIEVRRQEFTCKPKHRFNNNLLIHKIEPTFNISDNLETDNLSLEV